MERMAIEEKEERRGVMGEGFPISVWSIMVKWLTEHPTRNSNETNK